MPLIINSLIQIICCGSRISKSVAWCCSDTLVEEDEVIVPWICQILVQCSPTRCRSVSGSLRVLQIFLFDGESLHILYLSPFTFRIEEKGKLWQRYGKPLYSEKNDDTAIRLARISLYSVRERLGNSSSPMQQIHQWAHWISNPVDSTSPIIFKNHSHLEIGCLKICDLTFLFIYNNIFSLDIFNGGYNLDWSESQIRRQYRSVVLSVFLYKILLMFSAHAQS